MNYSGQHVLVLGLGESGLAMARWLRHCGAQVRVADTREAPQRLPALLELAATEGPALEFVSGELTAALLDGVQFVAVSPGLAPRLELAQILPAAQERNIPVWGEIELFAQALAALKETGYAPKVIAITGTNGKTTVTSIVGLLCARAGLTVQVAGNISPAALDVLLAAVQNQSLPQVWVLELSSFQLHFTYSLQADAATVLNVTQDHLDWHLDMDEYASDKARIFAAQTVRVLNRDDASVMKMQAPEVEPAPVAKKGAAVVEEEEIALPPPAMISFGCNVPQTLASFGLTNERGVLWLSQAVLAEEGAPVKRRKKGEAAPPVELALKHLMPADALKIRGQHNAANALAALALCRAIGLPFAPLLHGLRDYQG
ncbi:MAG: UDP-N-acetylmuramoyl-L-alanine--D-glutamate ligase, partial [Burkholderiales bacterium]|nr:UDP-N-acetylmuramoyl-L-alanine--D-glutamate ligase [Burkholderiales bacterium]